MQHFDTDVAVIGSGFGGSVAALRLSEKGYGVTVIEAGRRFAPEDLPRTSWNLRSFLWAPRLGLRGIQRVSLLRDVLVLSGAGVGGGSLVYANTLFEPHDEFYDDPQWAHLADWRTELAPHYQMAKRMLGVTQAATNTPADRVMEAVATEMGTGSTFGPVPVGVYLGEPGVEVPDPYFGGAGPRRTGCIECGECMTGCRHGAKNTLDQNYLYLAEANGVSIQADTEVVALDRVDGGYRLSLRRPGAWFPRTRTLTAEQVVLSAGTLGTQRLLHRMRDQDRLEISPCLGSLTRTNSEQIVGAVARRPSGFDRGVAITSSFHPSPETHVQPVRYGRGSNAMGLLGTIMVDGGGRMPRWVRFLGQVAARPIRFARSLSVRRWSERTLVILVMQSVDNSLRVVRRLGPFGRRLTTRPGHGPPNPRWLPVGNEVARRAAALMGGEPGSSINEAVLDIPITAHIIGGCPIGATPAEGVVDQFHRVHQNPGLHIADGSVVSANLGVNPALTITAMAERAFSRWPPKGEADQRPALDQSPRRSRIA